MNDGGSFPYPYRPCQRAMVAFIRSSVERSCPAVIESGTGTGKTATSLAGVLDGLPPGCKTVFLTRTKSQHRQVASECRAISRSRPLLSVAFQGRSSSTCPFIASRPELSDGTPEELSALCSALKKDDTPDGGCQFYRAIDKETTELCLSFIRSCGPDSSELADFCAQVGVCPYEIVKRVLPYADVVSAAYVVMFDPGLRARFLEWMGVSEKEVALIVDEAHNLPSFLRESRSYRMTRNALELASKEAESFGDPLVGQAMSASEFVGTVASIMDSMVSEYIPDGADDGLIPQGRFEEMLMSAMHQSSLGLRQMVGALGDLGSDVAGRRMASGKLPRSHLRATARFLSQWMDTGGESGYAYIAVGGDAPALEAFCLDPSEAAMPLRTFRASVCMSGTLEPLGQFCNDLGLYRAERETFPSPFNPDNRRVLYLDDVSSEYESLRPGTDMFARMIDHIVDIIGCVRVNTAVFFPSYRVMEMFLSEKLTDRIGRPVFCEEKGMSAAELNDMLTGFRITRGAVLISVCGGRISEGLDFPGDEMELAILVGIPYGTPTAHQEALRRYESRRFHNSWDIVYRIPAIRKMRQSIGRLIRSENDRGIAVVLDRRAAGLPGLEAELSTDPISDVRSFFVDTDIY